MKKRILAAVLAAMMVLCLLPMMARADEPLKQEGLFAGKFRAGTQLFDCQRATSPPYYVYGLARPFTNGGQFTEEELKNRYFAFKKEINDGVGLYLFEESDDAPVDIAGKTDANGKLGEGKVIVIANEGILFVLGGRWGYFISNGAAYRYGDFDARNALYLTTNAIENPTIEQLETYNATDILLNVGEMLVRFFPNAGSDDASGMPDPYYVITVGEGFVINASTPTRSGFTFVGWNSNADGTGVTYLNGATYKSNVGLDLYAQWITNEGGPKSQDPPKDIVKIDAAVRGDKGSLTPTSTAMQYRTADDAYTWYWCTDTFTSVSSGEYWVRYAPKDGYCASSEVYVGKVLEPAATPVASDFVVAHLSEIGANDGTITQTNTSIAYEYRTSSTGLYQDLASTGIENLPAGSVQIRAKKTSGTSLASLPLTLYVRQPASAIPSEDLFSVTHVTSYGGWDGSIDGVNSTMEYGQKWGTEIYWHGGIYGDRLTGLSAGEYYIRYKQTDTTLASGYVTLVVKEPGHDAGPPSGLSVMNAMSYGGDGEIRGTDTSMEYSLDGTTIWVDCTASLTIVKAGVYNVRYKETPINVPSPSAQVTVTQPNAIISFQTHPANTTVTAGSISGALAAAASVLPSGTATLNWYVCDEAGTISGDSLGTGGTFAIPTTLAEGTYYYRCQATYADAEAVNSNVAAVTVNAISFVSSLGVPLDGTYCTGQDLDFTVNFSQTMKVVASGGTPRLSITIGDSTRYADYLSGSGTSTLLFRYTVEPGLMDSDGIAVGSLALNGGAIEDMAGNDANLSLCGVGDTRGILVDAVPPIISAVTTPASGTYIAGEHLIYTVNFSKDVIITGTPYLTLTIGLSTIHADYQSGSGTSQLIFRYTILPGVKDNDGVALASSVSLGGGTIRDAAGNNAILTFTGGTASDVLVKASQTITFNNPGAQSFGANPTLTATSSSGLPVTFLSDTPDVCTITNGGILTFLKTGTATIQAVQMGNSVYLPATTVTQSFVVIPVPPGSPTNVRAMAGDTQATVYFTAPAFLGGANITGYTVMSSPGGFTASGVSSPITVTGLTHGVAYTFTVTATNSVGTGTASWASNSVTTVIPIYTITSSGGTGVKISPGGVVSVAEGGSRTFTITAAANYRIAFVLVDRVNKGAISSYTFNNVTANHTITATATATPPPTPTSAPKDTPAESLAHSMRTIAGTLLDSIGSPISRYVMELHSDPMTTVTDKNGRYIFYDVEYTNHKLVVKTPADEIVAAFELAFSEGEEFGMAISEKGVNITYTQSTETVNIEIKLISDKGSAVISQVSDSDKLRSSALLGEMGSALLWIGGVVLAGMLIALRIIISLKKERKTR